VAPIPAERIVRPDDRRQERIGAQLVVVDEILVAERQADHPLGHQPRGRMLDVGRIALVDETPGEARQQARPALDRRQQRQPALGADPPTVERRHQPATATDTLQLELARSTVCH